MEDVRRPFALDPGIAGRGLPEIDTRGLAHDVAQYARVGWFAAQAMLTARLTQPLKLPEDLRARMPNNAAVSQSLRDLLRRDRDNVAAGYYRAPQGMASGLVSAVSDAVRFFRDVPNVDRRRRDQGHDEIFRDLSGRGRASAAATYPRYYLQNFHYQTGGYLSAASARLYDHQVEVLFHGGADAMRRQLMVPMVRHLRARAAAGCRATRISLLDVACGTGRFLRSVKENYPRMPVYGLDLSAPYLERAARALSGFRRAGFVQGNGEALPFPDASVDVVTSIFMFHELPKKARAAVAHEMARVVRPNGIVLFMDSIQRGDVPAFDPLLESFPVAFHEPYYTNYVESDLEALFGDAGLIRETVEIHFMARLMVFRPAGSA